MDGQKTGLATLAGGCFWCLEAVYEQVHGVENIVSGYSGGHVAQPTYRQVCSETTGHAETVQVTFDSQIISYEEILDVFFAIHDPTTLNRQGNDRGLSYRSGIYYVDEEQKRVAEDTIADVDASGLWDGKVVTEVQPVGEFWEAEPDHQDYLEKRPGGYTCHFVRPGWVLPKRQKVDDVQPAAGTAAE